MTLKNELQPGPVESGVADAGSDDSEQPFSRVPEDLQMPVSRQSEQLESLEAERNSLLSISSSLQEEVEELRHALSQAAASADDDSATGKTGESGTRGAELERVTHERDELERALQQTALDSREHGQTIEALREQIKEHDSAAQEQLATIGKALEGEQQRLAVLQAESAARDAQLESARIESSQKDVELDILRDELEVARQQVADLQRLVEQGDERTRRIEDDYQETARKSHEDLRRKNDNEKEMQGQIDRLRKQLEQTSRDHQKSRVSAQEDLDNLRDELHAERQARAEERAQMAARQRELKEQLAAVATEHEVNFGRQSNVIDEAVDAVRTEERSRLQGVLDAHAATEEQLANLQQELQQAHAEMVVFRHQERERHQADISLMQEQYLQAETAIKQLESQLRQLTRERDTALEEQNELREKVNALRGEVEVARGLMNVSASGQLEDPVRLRKQLDETRRNVEIAVRLRAEAEAARDRLINERNALLAQLEGGQAAGTPLYIPSLDDGEASAGQGLTQQAGSPHNAGSAEPVRAVTAQAGAADTGARGTRIPGWHGGMIGILVAGAVALGGWLLVSSWLARPETGVTGLAVAPPSAPAGQGATVSMDNQAGQSAPASSPAGTVAQIYPPPIIPEPVQPEAPVSTGERPRVAPVAVTPPAGQEPAAETAVDSGITSPPSTRPARSPVIGTFRDTLKIGGEGPLMVELALAGYFMGSYGNSLNYQEVPRHLVRLPGFSIGRYEVTFAEYDRFARATGRRLPHDENWGRGNRPVINVTWKDARDYADWLSVQTGHDYRLPTEAEWEYAARGGSYWRYWWMDAEDADATGGVWANCHNCGSDWDGMRTAPAGMFPANAYGLHDMAGNVQEWIADCYHDNYEGAPADGSAWVRPHCTQRVVRGGGYTSPLDTLRSARRGQLDQDTRLDNLGFRVVRENR